MPAFPASNDDRFPWEGVLASRTCLLAHFVWNSLFCKDNYCTIVQLHSVYVLSTPSTWISTQQVYVLLFLSTPSTWISTQQVYVLLFLSTPSTYTVFNLDWINYLPLYKGRFLAEPGRPGNTGGSWVATFAAVPNLDGTFAILYFWRLCFSASDFLFVFFVLTIFTMTNFRTRGEPPKILKCLSTVRRGFARNNAY